MDEARDATASLRRLFHGGALRRLPRNPRDADLLMALALTGLDADAALDESEINLHLMAWLNGIVADNGPDHVTLRRNLVDFGFLRRSSDGVIYRVERERIDEVLGPEAGSVDARAILAAVEAERRERREAFRA